MSDAVGTYQSLSSLCVGPWTEVRTTSAETLLDCCWCSERVITVVTAKALQVKLLSAEAYSLWDFLVSDSIHCEHCTTFTIWRDNHLYRQLVQRLELIRIDLSSHQ
jgi:hypothetical protein